MLKKVFHFKYLYWGLAFSVFLFVMAFFFLNSSRGKDRFWGGCLILFGVAALCIAAVEVVKRMNGRIKVRRSPSYPEMVKDFGRARSLFRGHLFLGEHYLFSAYAGEIFQRENVSYLGEEIYSPPRGTTYVRLLARMADGRTVKIASYVLRDQAAQDISVLIDAGYKKLRSK